MPLTQMEHYLVLTDDLEATRAFYCDLLGMEAGYRPPLDFLGYWLYVGETPAIHVAGWHDYERYARGAGMPIPTHTGTTGPVDHIAFTGTGHDELAARLDAAGVEYQRNEIPDIGLRQIFVHDPSGVRIELNFRS